MARHVAQANLLPTECQFTVKTSNITEIVTACTIMGIEVWLLAFGGTTKESLNKIHVTSGRNRSSSH